MSMFPGLKDIKVTKQKFNQLERIAILLENKIDRTKLTAIDTGKGDISSSPEIVQHEDILTSLLTKIWTFGLTHKYYDRRETFESLKDAHDYVREHIWWASIAMRI